MSVDDSDVPRVVVDVDGVLATGGREVYSNESGWAYERCKPVEAGIDLVRALFEAGIVVVLHTARWEEDRATTAAWLDRHRVPYHELVMRKPFAHAYVDDRGWPGAFVPEEHGTAAAVEALIALVRARASEG